MSHAKYVIYEDAISDIPIPVIFPNHVQHINIHQMLDESGEKPLSAGFVYLQDGLLIAHGESLSLGVRSRAEDTEILNRMVGGRKPSGYEQLAGGLANRVMEKLVERQQKKVE